MYITESRQYGRAYAQVVPALSNGVNVTDSGWSSYLNGCHSYLHTFEERQIPKT